MDLDLPDAVPVDINADALVANPSVEPRAGGVDDEEVGIAVVVKGVEREDESIVVPHAAVALEHRGDQGRGVTGVDLKPDVEGVRIVGQADGGGKAGGSALVGLLLDEVGDGLCELPAEIVQATVHDRGFVYSQGSYCRHRFPGRSGRGEKGQSDDEQAQNTKVCKGVLWVERSWCVHGQLSS